MKRLTFVLLTALFVVIPAAARADAIPVRTGVDAAGNVLNDGAFDPFWTISLDQGATFQPAKVAYPSVLCCGMETVTSEARWISDPSINDGSPATGWILSTPVIAQRAIDLTHFDASTASISGLWRAADLRLGIFVNGLLVGNATADGEWGFTADQPFFSTGLFHSGINTLTLTASSVNSLYDGFWLDATVNATPAEPTTVPEPGSLILFGTGLVVLGARRLGRKTDITLPATEM